jgi:hypothetical protein
VIMAFWLPEQCQSSQNTMITARCLRRGCRPGPGFRG